MSEATAAELKEKELPFGSFNDHYYSTPRIPGHMDNLSNVRLFTNKQYCFCTPCLLDLSGISSDYQFNEWVGEHIVRRIEPAVIILSLVSRVGGDGTLTSAQFALSFPWNASTIRRLVVIRLPLQSDRNNGQRYW